VQVRDWGNVIRASSELLDRVVSKPTAPPVEPEIETDMTPEDVKMLTTEQLMKLVAAAKPYTTALLPGQRLFGDLEEEVRDVRDTIASHEEATTCRPSGASSFAGSPVPDGKLGLPEPFVGVTFEPTEPTGVSSG
jgi:hypothetical protein